jgi:uncharacterized protein (DUF1697 family)
MPGTHVALLRGINVGKAKRVAMADLRRLFEDLGYEDVRTLLNSGNVVFTGRDSSSRASSRIEKAMTAQLGLSVRVMVVGAAELKSVMKENSLLQLMDNPSRLLVAFPGKPSDLSGLKLLEKQDWSPDALAVGSHAAYVWCPDGISVSRLIEEVGRAMRTEVTTRNWATVSKLLDILEN